MKTEPIRIPVQDGPYRRIYAPGRDIYKGIDTPHFRNGTIYDKWIVNDFSILKSDDGVWHAVGITHPKPPNFKDAFEFDESCVHEAENQLFHAVWRGTLPELYERGEMEECEKILYPSERPGQRPECWAPALFKMTDGYGLLYSPEQIDSARSRDLFRWEIVGTLFEGPPGTRDPFVFFDDGRFVIVYNQNENLWYRESADMISVGEPRLLLHNGFGAGVCMESPFMLRRNGLYYLFWSAYDGQNGCYDNRTYVYAAPFLDEIDGKLPLTMLRAHAPEFALGEDGRWYMISVFYPENGLSAAPIRWVNPYE